jgi:hypothetical protein
MITDQPSQTPPDQDEENDKRHAQEARAQCVDIRNNPDRPKVQKQALKAARGAADQIKNQDIKKVVEDEIADVEKNYMHKGK